MTARCTCGEREYIESRSLCTTEVERIPGPSRPCPAHTRYCNECGHTSAGHIDGIGNTKGCPGFGFSVKGCGCQIPADLIGTPFATIRRNPTWSGPEGTHRQYLADALVGQPITIHEPGPLDLCALYGNVLVSRLGVDEAWTFVSEDAITEATTDDHRPSPPPDTSWIKFEKVRY